MTTPLPADQVEAIVQGNQHAPASHRWLTAERQIQFCKHQIAQEQATCDPYAVVRTEQVQRDANGAPMFEKDGRTPKIIEVKTLKRDLAGEHWREQLVKVQASYRRRLAKSNAEHSEDGEALQRAIQKEFGDVNQRAGQGAEISAFARDYQREHGHFTG